MAQVREFIIPPMVLFGPGALKNIADRCKVMGVRKALIVTDKVVARLGMLDELKKILGEACVSSAVFDQVDTEPTTVFVREGLSLYKNSGCDFIVAIGGGSPIDAAKGISVMATNPGKIEAYKGTNKVMNKGVPLIAIPTTAGTGSEVSRFTVITDPDTSVKMLLGSPFIVPDVALVDPLLTLSCPKGLTAAVAIDALTHAIEAYVSVKSQPTSDIFCLSAITLISRNLRQAWAQPDNVNAREKTMLGAMHAGIAFSNSSVALVHGMSRPIGAHFHVAHGVSNATLLYTIMKYSLPGNPERYSHIAAALGVDAAGKSQLQAAEAGCEAVGRLIADVKIPGLAELGVDRTRLLELAPKMARDAIDSGSPANNPRQATEAEIVDLYKSAYDGN